jgi:hypothetical protein
LGTNEQLGLGLESDAEWVAGISFRKGRVLRQALRLAIVASHEEPPLEVSGGEGEEECGGRTRAGCVQASPFSGARHPQSE